MSKNKLVVVGLAVLWMAATATAQTSANTSGAASNQATVTADRSGAQAATQTSANISASASHEGQRSAKAAANGSNSTDASVSKSGAQLGNGSTINAVLSKPLDVKKNKPGDPVTAKVTDNVKSSASGSSGVLIPKGSRLVGHVTEAKRRDPHAAKQHAAKKEKDGKAAAGAASEADSALGIVFDKAILKNGQQVPLHAVVQAVAASQQDLTAGAWPADLSGSGSAMGSGGGMVGGGGGGLLGGGGGLVSGVGSTVGAATTTVGDTTASLGNTVGGAVNTTTNAAGSVVGATTATGQLTSSASGVVGLRDLHLTSTATGATQGSLITSSTRDVRLDSGTQMLLRVTGAAR